MRYLVALMVVACEGGSGWSTPECESTAQRIEDRALILRRYIGEALGRPLSVGDMYVSECSEPVVFDRQIATVRYQLKTCEEGTAEIACDIEDGQAQRCRVWQIVEPPSGVRGDCGRK